MMWFEEKRETMKAVYTTIARGEDREHLLLWCRYICDRGERGDGEVYDWISRRVSGNE